MRHSLKNLFAFTLVLTSIIWVSTLTLIKSDHAKVFFLYTQKEPIPQMLFNISSVPLAIASYVKYGSAVFDVRPITKSAVDEAFSKATFLIIGAHGANGEFLTDDGFEVRANAPAEASMKLVFFGSCNIGQKEAAWKTKFPNAVIKSYSRPMYPIEAWFNLVFRAPIDLLINIK